MQGRSSPILVRLLSFARPYWRIVLLAWVCVLGNAAFTLALPLLLAAAIDTGLGPDGGRTYLIWIGVAVVAMAALRGAFAFGMTYMGEVLSSRVAYDLRNDIYNHLQRLSFAYHDKAQTGEVMSRATQDVEAVRMFISMGLLRLMLLIVLLVAIFFLMISVDWQLTIVAWAFVPIVAWRSINVSSRMRPIWMNVQNLQGRMATVLQENLSGIRVVKAFAREREESIKFAKEAKDLFENSYEANKIQAFNQPLLTGIWMLSLVAVAWFGAYRMNSGSLSDGDLTGFILYLIILQLPIRSLGWIITMFARTQSAGERIYEILDALRDSRAGRCLFLCDGGITGGSRVPLIELGYHLGSALDLDLERVGRKTVICAAGEDGTVAEHNGHGILTQCLLNELEGGDTPSISPNQLQVLVEECVSLATGDHQRARVRIPDAFPADEPILPGGL